MPRKVRDSNLETRTARARLKATAKPYFRLIEPGLHLGYRKLASGPGSWVVRRYGGNGKYSVRNLTTADDAVIVGDDFSDADGNSVLSFAQAQERAKAYRPAASGGAGPYTVGDVMESYIAHLESTRGTASTARYRYNAFIKPHFEKVDVEKLTTDRISKWMTALVQQPPRVRTKPGVEQKFRVLANDDESRRKRQATVNRTLTVLKAGLNRAWRLGNVTSDAAWRRVEPFHGVDSARIRYLTIAEAKRFTNTCAPDFRAMVQAALATGARYGQLAALTVSDFNPDNGTLRLRTRKGKGREKIYHAVLAAEGVKLFRTHCAGRAPTDLIFPKEDGSKWGTSHQLREMIEACERAKIEPPIGFHQLRHTWASHAVMNGVPLLVVAKNLGHSDTRMVELHYGHLAPSYVADAIRAGAPKFGFTVRPTAVALAP